MTVFFDKCHFAYLEAAVEKMEDLADNGSLLNNNLEMLLEELW